MSSQIKVVEGVGDRRLRDSETREKRCGSTLITETSKSGLFITSRLDKTGHSRRDAPTGV